MAFKKVKTGYYDRYLKSGLSQGELAGYSGDPYSLSGIFSVNGSILPRRDDILLQEGGGSARAIEAYMRLFNDSQVLSAWTKLIGEIIQRDWQILPASQSDIDLEIAEFVRVCIRKMGVMTRQTYGNETLVTGNSAFDSFTHGMGESLILGMAAGEICWMRQGKRIIPSEIKIRDPRRFIYKLNEDGTVSPRLLTINSPIEGLPIPCRSMIIHRHWAYSGFMDPYGSGLGRQLYSLVEFRRTLMSYWIQFADKHTTPTAIGTYELGTPEDEVVALQCALQRLGQETAITVPEEIKIDWLQSDGRPELYNDIITYVDQQISYVVNGESTAGQDTGNVGSYARDQISDSIRKKKARAFSEELDETLNSTLIRWIVELNYPNHIPPTIKRNFDDLRQKDDPIKVVQMLTQLQSIGYKVGDLDWVKEKLDIDSLYIDESSMEDPKQEYGSSKEGSWDFIEQTMDQQIKEEEKLEPSRNQIFSGRVLEDLNGPLDDIGFERISIDVGGQESSIAKIHIDEFTTVGEINNGIAKLLDNIDNLEEINEIDRQKLEECRNRYNYQKEFEDDIGLSKEDLDFIQNTYKMIYRLARRIIFKEAVVIDPIEMGYWRWFAPYFLHIEENKEKEKLNKISLAEGYKSLLSDKSSAAIGAPLV